MNYLYGLLIALTLNLTLTGTTLAQTNNDCTNPEKKASRDSTCISAALVTTAKQVTPSSMGVGGTSFIVIPYQNCTAPWGSTIPHGSGVTAFLATSGTSCVNETRNCNNGVLSGSYQYQSCTATPTCTNNASGTDTAVCDAGYTGNKARTRYTNSCTGAITYGAWNTSGCTATSTCTDDASGTETAVCDAGYTGNKTRARYTNSCTGVITYGTWNTSGCTATTCENTIEQESSSCPRGYSGTRYRDNIVDCNGDILSTGTWDDSGCTPDSVEPTCTETTTTQTGSCPANYSGSTTRDRIVNSCTGTSYTAWDDSGCTPNPPTCWEDSWPNTYSCPANYSGESSSVTYMECPSGPYGSPTFTERDRVDTCEPDPPTCWEDSWPNVYSCPAGQEGENSSITYMECPSGPYGSATFTQRDFVNTCAPTCPNAGEVQKWCYYQSDGNEGCEVGTYVWGANVIDSATCTETSDTHGSAYYSDCPGRIQNGSCPVGY